MVSKQLQLNTKQTQNPHNLISSWICLIGYILAMN